MGQPLNNINAFSLIELLVVIIVIGVAAGIGIQWMGADINEYRRTKTQQELDMLAAAIVGNSDIQSGGGRSEFGYVGDIGAFPPNLTALYRNPGGYSTWNGPYPDHGIVQDTTGFTIDAWGQSYSYTGGIMITSTGGGSALIKKIADDPTDYLLNALNGTVRDADDSLPGAVYADSIDLVITIPDGSGGILSKTYHPDSIGVFGLDSLPAGLHPLQIIYTPANDTLRRYVTILPRHKSQADYKFAASYFSSGAAACDSSGIIILRPDGDGSKTELSSSGGCASNWECVDESVPDNNATRVRTSDNNYQIDLYALPDPSSGTCQINKVTVYGRAQKATIFIPGYIKMVVQIDGNEYEGSEQAVTNSYADYSFEWTNNPATGFGWTWVDIGLMEAGISLYTTSPASRVSCTQVWVEVDYSP